MDLEETEARNDCADENHQQFNRQTDEPSETRQEVHGYQSRQTVIMTVLARISSKLALMLE
jgi:hypothetical protein